jgi:hypothetical protein
VSSRSENANVKIPSWLPKTALTFVLTVAATWLGRIPVENWLSSRVREQQNIPQIVGTRWKTTWEYDDGRPALSDTVTVSNWTKDSFFEGFGEIDYPGNRHYKYSIRGEVSPNRVVILNYKAEQYPTQASIGTACLVLSTNAEILSGRWIGFQDAAKPVTGRVTMHKVIN